MNRQTRMNNIHKKLACGRLLTDKEIDDLDKKVSVVIEHDEQEQIKFNNEVAKFPKA